MPDFAVVPGSFDPVTLGHIDIIERAAKNYDKVYAVVAVNPDKEYMFSLEQRLFILEKAIAHIENAEAVLCEGIVAELARKLGAKTLVKGIRNETDRQYEDYIKKINKKLAPEIETVYYDTGYENISSTLVRKMLANGENIECLVGTAAAQAIAEIK